MKKIKLIMISLLLSVTLVGCNNDAKEEEALKKEQEKIEKENEELKEEIEALEKEKEEETQETKEDTEEKATTTSTNNTEKNTSTSNNNSSTTKPSSNSNSNQNNNSNSNTNNNTTTDKPVEVEKPPVEEYNGLYCTTCGAKSYSASYCPPHVPQPPTDGNPPPVIEDDGSGNIGGTDAPEPPPVLVD